MYSARYATLALGAMAFSLLVWVAASPVAALAEGDWY